MSSLPEPPPGLDLNETKVPALVSGFVVTWVFEAITVGLRIAARRLVGNPLWWDDWLKSCFTVTVRGGFGRRLWAAPENELEVYFQGLFAAEYLYTFSIVFVKLSILALYWRILGSLKSTRIPIWILSGIVIAWGIAVILVTTFQCWPVSAFWLRFSPSAGEMTFRCPVDVRMFFIAHAIPNIITDICILLVPVPGIWTLQLRTGKKIALLGIFALGLFVTAVSFVRLYYVVALDFNSLDVTWLFSEEMMWTGIEVNLGTVCACLPSLKPVFYLALYGTAHQSTPRTTGASRFGIITIGGSGDPRKHERGVRLESPNDEAGSSTSIVPAPRNRQFHEDTHPFSTLTDNDSDTWQDRGSHDLEMDPMQDEQGRTRTRLTVGKADEL
ncbi:integral membrane protein [Fusarium flagelliforme]|uniref:Integral membrane protein n=1 Tax=Fusarium flagelliforme TaxID=2675880 RepID=A0A395MAL0_9HYPO|nr:integral membrane protein [Fusarium flagelliforme]